MNIISKAASGVALALSLTLAAPVAFAQASRADVKADAAKAKAAGQVPSGEQGAKEAPFKSDKTRVERKAETKEAIAKGEVNSRGEASAPEKEAKPGASNVSRAAVKADAKAATKSGKTKVTEHFPETTK